MGIQVSFSLMIDYYHKVLKYLSLVWRITLNYCSNRNCSLPDYRPAPRRDRGGRKTLLAIVSLVFGMEVAYKFATKTVIFLLNPCHVITALQVLY